MTPWSILGWVGAISAALVVASLAMLILVSTFRSISGGSSSTRKSHAVIGRRD